MTPNTSIIQESFKHIGQDRMRLLLYFQMVQFSCLPLILSTSSYLSMGITSSFKINKLVVRSSYSSSNTVRISSFLQPKSLSLLSRLLLLLDSIQGIHNKHFLLESTFLTIHFTSPSLFPILPFHPITLSIVMIFSRASFLQQLLGTHRITLHVFYFIHALLGIDNFFIIIHSCISWPSGTHDFSQFGGGKYLIFFFKSHVTLKVN